MKITERRRGDNPILLEDATKVLHHAQQLFGAFKAISNNSREEEEGDRVVEKMRYITYKLKKIRFVK